MKTWVRAVGDAACGYCGALILSGQPMLQLVLPGVSRRRVRCESCAGPVDWTQVHESEQARVAREATRPERMQRIGDVKPAAFDAKMAAAGRDE